MFIIEVLAWMAVGTMIGYALKFFWLMSTWDAEDERKKVEATLARINRETKERYIKDLATDRALAKRNKEREQRAIEQMDDIYPREY